MIDNSSNLSYCGSCKQTFDSNIYCCTKCKTNLVVYDKDRFTQVDADMKSARNTNHLKTGLNRRPIKKGLLF